MHYYDNTQQYKLLHSAISKQQTYPTLNSTNYYTVRYQNNKPILHSTVHIVTQCHIKKTNLSYTQQYILLHSTILT